MQARKRKIAMLTYCSLLSLCFKLPDIFTKTALTLHGATSGQGTCTYAPFEWDIAVELSTNEES